MKNLVYLLVIFSYVTAVSQTFDTGNIQLSILKDTLTTRSDDPRINLSFSVKNGSNSSFILYELNSKIVRDRFGTIDPYCAQENTSAAIILYVFDEESKPVTAIHWYINDLRNPMTKERFDSIMSSHKESYLKRAVILKKFQEEDFEQEIDMQEFQLEKGRYFIQLLYFAGKRIRNFVTEDEILKDKAHFGAEVFQGCLISDKRVLIVR